jgi:hypothetical protein
MEKVVDNQPQPDVQEQQTQVVEVEVSQSLEVVAEVLVVKA